jgi:hypothetical protein
MLENAVAEDEAEHREAVRCEAVRRAIQEMSAFIEKLNDIEPPPEHLWFRNLLVGILNSAYQNYNSVEIGAAKMPTLAAWGCRNLLELRVITIYVLRSKEDAQAFKDDLAADAKELWEAAKLIAVNVDKTLIIEMRAYAATVSEPMKSEFLAKATAMETGVPNLTGLEDEVRIFQDLMNDFGINLKRKPKQGSQIAGLVKESEMFAPRFKVYSKLVHPTALSIAASTTPNSLDALMPLLSSQAATDLLSIFYSIREHVDAHAIGWPYQ